MAAQLAAYEEELSSMKLVSVEWQNDGRIINWKGFERKRS
jgi:hypothetical protein